MAEYRKKLIEVALPLKAISDKPADLESTLLSRYCAEHDELPPLNRNLPGGGKKKA